MSKRKKTRIKPMPVIVTAAVVVLIIAAFIAVVVSSSKKKDENGASVVLDKTDLKPHTVEIPTVAQKTTVDILMDDCAVTVGSTFKVYALVTPDNTEKALVWTSSNDGIVSVDKDGNVSVKGIGTVSLTATVGDVSDAVMIEGIPNVTAGSVNDLPVYIVENTGSGNGGSLGNVGDSDGSDNSGSGGTGNGGGTGNSGSGGSSGGSGSGGGTGNSGSGGSSGGSGSGGGTGNSGVSSGGGSTGNSGSGDSSGNGGTGNSGVSSGGGSTGNGGTGSEGAGNSGGTDNIAEAITGNGFSQTMSNVYVCQENGVYYGEIITQNNVTIIYIKQRNDAFDNRIKAVIEGILPGYSSQVWSNYISASSDRTFSIEGRTVRIVVATGGGHSQIVIYN